MNEDGRETATETNVVFDVLAILDESPSGRLVGSDSTVIESVVVGERDSVVVTLDNGQSFRLVVREV